MTDPAAPTTPRSDAMDLGYAIGVLSNIAEGRGPAREMAKVALARIGRDDDPVRSTPAEALQEALALIEQVDQRCLAADGPVSRIQAEMTDVEWRRLYILIKSAARTEGDTA